MSKWYILHTLSGSENSAKRMIEEQIARNQHIADCFDEIVVPTIQTPKISRGEQVVSEQRFMPGYVLIKMKMNDETWRLVTSVPKISGFLGSKTTPHPLSEEKVQSIFQQVKSASQSAAESALYTVGDKVSIIDGPFDSFSGVVEEVDISSQVLKVSVSIFGKMTPIELNFTQVVKRD